MNIAILDLWRRDKKPRRVKQRNSRAPAERGRIRSGDRTLTGPAPLSDTAQRRLHAARLWITINRPYYARALYACQLVPIHDVDTMAIDERWNIYLNPSHVESCSVAETAASLIHELNHVLRGHANRARRLPDPPGTGTDGAVSHLVWNIATDCEINDDLQSDGLHCDGLLLPEMFDLARNRAAEHYYNKLTEQTTVPATDPGCGSGCTGHESGYELPASGSGIDESEQELLRHHVAVAVEEHVKARGRVPAGLQRWADTVLRPKASWQQILARSVKTAVHLRAGASDYTWQRPSRREQPDDAVIRAGMTRTVPDLAVVVDTSGSMSDTELAQALAEIRSIIARVVPGEALTVLATDAAVASAQRVFNPRQINLLGGGGTDMRVGIAEAAKTKPTAIIVITDGHTPWPATPPKGVPTVIAALTDGSTQHTVPKWNPNSRPVLRARPGRQTSHTRPEAA